MKLPLDQTSCSSVVPHLYIFMHYYLVADFYDNLFKTLAISVSTEYMSIILDKIFLSLLACVARDGGVIHRNRCIVCYYFDTGNGPGTHGVPRCYMVFVLSVTTIFSLIASLFNPYE